ncbi:MAG: hypothetical protein LKM32_06175 [Chiayiivirga sp.]|jgi:hypothetical protein|uniref:hypothetical protein n=1 Tax=Chiayiivirga sp. TaxID=2041042 RepID=UPI0025BD2F5A|nr:hypothetical protein [Chiayiivirga sp.]MCI1710227.1 hypothetical protein [Chiayiivirga sp.]MCI1728979.1 hypothetical protein [Chiayiivirga sp.]
MTPHRFPRLVAAALLMGLSPFVAAQVGTAFTYQGELKENGAPKPGTVDLRFDAFTLDTGGLAINAVPVILDSVPLSNGVFTVQVDFGPGVFTGAQVFVEVGVREDALGDTATTTGFATLSPRQAATPTPYAQHAERVAQDAVGGSQIADGGVTGADIADGTITAADVNTTSTSVGLQRVLSAPCPANQALRSISVLGTPTCIAPVVGVDTPPGSGISSSLSNGVLSLSAAAPPSLARLGHSVIDTQRLGSSPSIIVGADGLPILSYFQPVDGDLRVMHCRDPQCVAHEDTLIDSAGIVGEFSSITIRNNGLPAISYYDRSLGNLKLAYCLDAACTTHSLATVDSIGDVGQYTSLVSGDSTFAPLLVFYHDAGNGDLKSAKCGLTSCPSPTFVTLDSTGNVGKFASAAVGSATGDTSRVWVAYVDETNSAIKILGCIAFGCDFIPNTATVVEAGITGVDALSLTIGGDLRAWVTYNDGTVQRLARCTSSSNCATATAAVVPAMNGSGALSTGLDGVVWIAGRTSSGRPKLGRCETVESCAAASIWTLDSFSEPQPSPMSLALGSDGTIVVATTAGVAAGSELRIGHCANPRSCADSAWSR